MALIGAQLVITLIFASIIQKLSYHFSFAKWLLSSTRLTRYVHPSDDELRAVAGIDKPKDKTYKTTKDKKKDTFKSSNTNSSFYIPRNINIQLETVKITQQDVVQLNFFNEYQWLIDFALYSLMVYTVSEIYHFFIPLLKTEINLSVLWCVMMVFFSLKLLFSLTKIYFKSNESIGERSTCIVAGLVYFLTAMVVVIIPEKTLDLRLNTALDKFNQSTAQFFIERGISNNGPASKIVIFFFMAIFCGILGSLFTFPGFRFGKMHMDALKYCRDRRMLRMLLNINFALPFVLVLLWINPISRDYLTQRQFSGMKDSIMTPEVFELVRVMAISVAVLLRMILMPIYLQAYLNLAYDRIEEQKKEAGRITNIEFQKKVSSIFYYLCVVVLQYTAPILLCLFLSFIYKTLGEYTWIAAQSHINENEELLTDDVASNFYISLHYLKQIFTTEVYRGIFGFFTWWTCFIWFSSTSLGMFYQNYFSRKV